MQTGKDNVTHTGLTTGGYNPVNGVDAYAELWWGSTTWATQSEDRSGITLGVPVHGVVNTNGASAAAMSMSHTNKPVFGNWLLGGTVTAALELSARDPYNSTSKVLSTALEFDFYETPNTPGYVSDVFILTNPGATTEGFEYDGEWYTLDFTGSFDLIPDSYVELLGLDSSQKHYGWVTEENAMTTVGTSFTISHIQQPTPTPEPATVVLLLLGLGTLATVSHMKRRNAA